MDQNQKDERISLANFLSKLEECQFLAEQASATQTAQKLLELATKGLQQLMSDEFCLDQSPGQPGQAL